MGNTINNCICVQQQEEDRTGGEIVIIVGITQQTDHLNDENQAETKLSFLERIMLWCYSNLQQLYTSFINYLK